MTTSRAFGRAAALAALFLLAGALTLPAAHAQNGTPEPRNPEQVEETLPPEEGYIPVVEYKDGNLTVQAQEAPFGEIMSLISMEAGFEVAISPEIAEKVVSTSFKRLELQKAIQRLLSLISQRNYYIHYRPDDSVAKIEIYNIQQPQSARGNPGPQGISGPGVPVKPPSGPRRTGITTPEGRPVTGGPGRRPAVDRNPPSATSITGRKGGPPAPPVPRIGSIAPPASRPSPEDFSDSEVPLIVPPKAPEYIPPARKVD